MRSRHIGYIVALLVFAVDQLTKWIVTGPLSVDRVGDLQMILPFFNLTFTQNMGISLGLFEARSPTGQWILIAVTSAIAIGVAWWIGREEQRGDQLALGMVLGGALGNILDRVRFGYVVDFADLHFGFIPERFCPSYQNGQCSPFLVFNVADAAISIGVVILLLRAFLSRNERPTENIEHA